MKAEDGLMIIGLIGGLLLGWGFGNSFERQYELDRVKTVGLERAQLELLMGPAELEKYDKLRLAK